MIKGWIESVYTEAGFDWRELPASHIEMFWEQFLQTFVIPEYKQKFERAYNAGPAIRREWLLNASGVRGRDELAKSLRDVSDSRFCAAVMWAGPPPSNTAAYVLSGAVGTLTRLFPTEGDALAIFLGAADHAIGCVWAHEGTFFLSPARSDTFATLIRGA